MLQRYCHRVPGRLQDQHRMYSPIAMFLEAARTEAQCSNSDGAVQVALPM